MQKYSGNAKPPAILASAHCEGKQIAQKREILSKMKWLQTPKKGFLSVLGTSPAGVFGSSPLTSPVAHSQMIPKDVKSALTQTHAAVSSG